MYKKEITLAHNELPAKINVETGELTELPSISKRGNPNAVVFESNAKFVKNYDDTWRFLYYRTTAIELKVAHYMAMHIQPFTNSLEPLNDDSTVRELSDLFDISVNKVSSTLNKLFSLGVYGKFENVDADKGHTRYWIFNPYLSVHSKAIDRGILNLFDKTEIAKAFKASQLK